MNGGAFGSPPFLTAQAQARAEAKAQLMLRLRARGLRDLALLRAIESVPRENFVGPAHVDLALRDIAIPLPCGQTMEAPSTLAQMLAALAPRPGDRILEIGCGSGYSTAVLAMTGREVVSLECFQRLAQDARARLEKLGLRNAAVLWADGFEISPSYGLFDRILAHGALERVPANLWGALGEGGVLVAPRRDASGQGVLIRHAREAGDRIVETTIGPCRAQSLLRGLFRAS